MRFSSSLRTRSSFNESARQPIPFFMVIPFLLQPKIKLSWQLDLTHSEQNNMAQLLE
jgi:hypothetical protein